VVVGLHSNSNPIASRHSLSKSAKIMPRSNDIIAVQIGTEEDIRKNTSVKCCAFGMLRKYNFVISTQYVSRSHAHMFHAESRQLSAAGLTRTPQRWRQSRRLGQSLGLVGLFP
jgi:hypothetical protein